jgi:hypothetical protein
MQHNKSFEPSIIFWRCITITVIGLFALFRIVIAADHYHIFDGIINTGLGVIGFVVFLLTILKDIQLYQDQRIFKFLLPTCIGLIVGMAIFFLSRRDNSPTILYFSSNYDFNGVSIDFRKDGTYKLANYCLGFDYTRGKYRIVDSVITIDRNQIDLIIQSSRLVIRPFDTDTISKKSLYQMDENGAIIDRSAVFYLRKDNRDLYKSIK